MTKSQQAAKRCVRTGGGYTAHLKPAIRRRLERDPAYLHRYRGTKVGHPHPPWETGRCSHERCPGPVRLPEARQ